MALGTKPYRVDSADFVPLHRPRFCWTNVLREEIPGITVTEKEFWFEIHMPHQYPQQEQWMEEGWEPSFGDEEVVYPTCMKSIVRRAPPPGLRDLTSVMSIQSNVGKQMLIDFHHINTKSSIYFGRMTSGAS